jgi:REP element-mobilizing transposase RayT
MVSDGEILMTITVETRVKVAGGSYFFTVATHHCKPFLCAPDNIFLLRQCFQKMIQKYPFDIDAIVILPKHLHCIWTPPQGDADYSTRWRLIKSNFLNNAQVGLGESDRGQGLARRNKRFGKDGFGSIKFTMNMIGGGM